MSLTDEIEALRKMTPAELRRRHLEVFGEPTTSGNRDHLFKRLAWRLQAQAEGGITARARAKAAELARDTDLRVAAPRAPAVRAASSSAAADRIVKAKLKPTRLPPPGTVLVRRYRGQDIKVTVLERGFDHDGTVYKSLSAVAQAVTGSHWNGFRFFHLDQEGRR